MTRHERDARRSRTEPCKPMTAWECPPTRASNRVFAAEGRHEGAVVFPRLGLRVITCLDPRVDPAFLGLSLGDALVPAAWAVA